MDWVKDRTSYSRMHKEAHPGFRGFIENLGASDLLLVDRVDKSIVYSTKKNIDFGTSLVSGPFADTVLAEAALLSLEEKEGSIYITDVVSYLPAFNKPVFFISTPVYNFGQITGALVLQFDTHAIESIMTSNGRWQEIGLGLTGETYLVGQDKTLRTNVREAITDRESYLKKVNTPGKQPYPEKIEQYKTGINLHQVQTPQVDLALSQKAGLLNSTNYDGKPVLSAYTPIAIGQHTWGLVSEIQIDEAFEASFILKKEIINSILISMLATLAVTIMITWPIANIFIKPLITVVESLQQLAQGNGDLTLQLGNTERKDEIGALSRSFNVFVEFMRDLVHQIQLATESLTAACLTLADLGEETQKMSTNQKSHIREVQNSIEILNARIIEVTNDIVKAEEHTEGAKLKIAESNNSTQQSFGSIEETNKAVNETKNYMHNLLNEVGTISTVLGVIDKIAEQTNLLALNAAIEAARAGEQGRGFAVVADEVRALAGKTQKSTVVIESTVKQLSKVTDQTSASLIQVQDYTHITHDQVSQSSTDILEVSEIISHMSEFSHSISMSAKEQTTAVDEINHSILGIGQVSNKVEETAQELGHSIDGLNSISKKITQLVSQFKVK
jgi:methyl-accepting chemotaxis protein